MNVIKYSKPRNKKKKKYICPGIQGAGDVSQNRWALAAEKPSLELPGDGTRWANGQGGQLWSGVVWIVVISHPETVVMM